MELPLEIINEIALFADHAEHTNIKMCSTILNNIVIHPLINKLKRLSKKYKASKTHNITEIEQFERNNNIILPDSFRIYLLTCAKSFDMTTFYEDKEHLEFMKIAKLYPGEFDEYLSTNNNNAYKGVLEINEKMFLVLNGKYQGNIWSLTHGTLEKQYTNLHQYLLTIIKQLDLKFAIQYQYQNIKPSNDLQIFAMSYNILRILSRIAVPSFTT